MKGDEYEVLATEIWRGNTQTIANLQEMDADDLQEVEKAFRDKYNQDISLNGTPAEIHFALGKIRATPIPG